MPRISEATVVQHRAVQHRAVLDAAERLIVANGGKAPSLTEVAAEVGLARTSVYRYVSSSLDVIIQLLLNAIPAWLEELTENIESAGSDPADRLAVYVQVTLRLFAEGSHGPLMAAAQSHPEAFTDERVLEAHDALEPAVHSLLGEKVAVARPLIDAAIQRGAEMVTRSGADLDMVSRMLQRMARASLEGDLEDPHVAH